MGIKCLITWTNEVMLVIGSYLSFYQHGFSIYDRKPLRNISWGYFSWKVLFGLYYKKPHEFKKTKGKIK